MLPSSHFAPIKHPLRIFAVEVGTPDALQSPANAESQNGLHAAMLAHEIRNPLASLELFVDLLEEEPKRETLLQLRAALRRVSGTVENVLMLHSGRTPQMEPVALGPEIAAIVAFARPVVQQAGLTLRLEGAELASHAMANPAGLQQILLNLILNAVRFTQAPGEVRVTLEQGVADRCRLSVADTGSGIAPEHLPHIFEPGWSARGASPGLGLAVCRRIAAAHGAVLKAHSAPGCGTVFAMEIPTL